MKIKAVRPPYRLLTNVLALALTLGALFYLPAPTSVNANGSCELGCIWWTQQCGCQQYSYCCANEDTYWCSYSQPYECQAN